MKQKALGLFPSLVGALSKRAQARAATKQQQSAKQDKLKQRFLVRHARDQKVTAWLAVLGALSMRAYVAFLAGRQTYLRAHTQCM